MRFVVRRSVADRSVVGAAALVILAATTLLGAGVLYAEAVAQAGLTARLLAGSREERGAEISLAIRPVEADATDATVRGVVDATFAGPGARTAGFGRSESWALPMSTAGAGAATPDLTIFESNDRLTDLGTLVDGAWPTAGMEPMEAVVSEPAAAAMGAGVGATLDVESRLDAGRRQVVRIVGIYRIADPEAIAWWGDELEQAGVQTGSFRTLGPLVVDHADLLSRTISSRASLMWRVAPDLSRIGPADVGALAGMTGSLQRNLEDALDASSTQVRVTTDLPGMFGRAEAALLSSASGIVVIVGQLAILAGYSLVLIAGVLLDHRRSETALLRARGTSTPRLLLHATLEGLLLVLPAVLLAPVLADALLSVIDPAAPFATTGVPLRPSVSPTVVAVAALVGVGCLIGLLVPAIASIGPIAAVRRTIGRQVRGTAPQRLGLDIMLVGLAVVGLWQLTRYGAPVVRTLRGSLGVDPVLVAAPALGLLAGAVVALRIVPFLGGAMERLLEPRRGLVASLAARELARRPLHATRAVLLLAFAAGIAVFSAGFAATWHRSQGDRIAFAVGTDIRFERPVRPSEPAWATSGRLGGIEGVRAALPVVRESIDLGQAGRGTLLALPAARASEGVAFRTDLADHPIRDLLAALPGEVPRGTALPADATSVDLDVLADLETVKPDPTWSVVPPGWPGVQAQLVVRDATGLVSRLAATPTPFGASPQTMRVDLAIDDADAVRPTGPIELLAVELWVRLPENTAAAGTLELRSIATHADPVSPATSVPFAPADDAWGLVANVPNSDPTPVEAYQRDGTRLVIPPARPLAGPIPVPSELTGNREVRFAWRPVGLAPQETDRLPALAGDRLLAGLGAGVGSPITVGERFADTRPLEVTGAVRGFPTIDPATPAAIVDLGALATHEYVHTARTLEPGEFWVGADDAALDTVTAAIADPAIGGTDVRVRAREADARLADPIAIGVIGALALGAVAALVFATIGIVVTALVSLRQRGRDVALLRALGLSSRQLIAALSAEHAFLLAVGSLIGIVLGTVLALVVLPAVTLDERAAVAVPPVHVEIPLEVPAALIVVAVLAFVGLVWLQARALRRDAPAAALRATEEQA